MPSAAEILEALRTNPKGVRFTDLVAKTYKVRQVIKAIAKLEAMR